MTHVKPRRSIQCSGCYIWTNPSHVGCSEGPTCERLQRSSDRMMGHQWTLISLWFSISIPTVLSFHYPIRGPAFQIVVLIQSSRLTVNEIGTRRSVLTV
ncbi:hypothetical protein P879_06650 [Paragonimus westermani]|uniref:Uncharacterized protein n=1 Tax=Paragonimus westermani TaxID=34504 RepID=A0A8T0CZ47_9TREM|nr:hypothetical protein P879_06650 [Paragonimus westermani]